MIGTVGMTVAQGILLRPDLGGIEGRETRGLYMLAAGALLGVLSWASARLHRARLGASASLAA